ncbi:BMP family ABC transporter substrate-binding protein [Treponema sp. UBA3813]|uniref:BMP family lipoprotein n=1 Tax=Treponema sp. UBA3813 TaxID=1947715 RepID=UPI0025FEAF7A|nr:BMP family ABC transporter substrate-binding protein [Treponema sp. UBA3813]
MKKSFSFLLFSFCFPIFFWGCHKDNTPAITSKLVTDGLGVNDKSYNASAWEGLLRFYGDSVGEEEHFGTLYDVAICNDSGKYFSDLRAISEEKPDLVIITGFVLTDAIRSVSLVYPEQKFLMIDGSNLSNENVQNYLFASEEGSYLVGMIAAEQSVKEGVQNPRFGFIGGMESDEIIDFEIGYVQGIRAVLPDAEVFSFYTDDWSRPALAAAKAKVWYEKGVYAIYTAAGMCGNGTIAEAVSHRKAGKNVWAIGVDQDQFGEGVYGVGKSAVLTSMIKRVDNAVEIGLNSVRTGAFKGGSRILSLKDKAVGFSTTNTELDPEVIKHVQTVQAEIISGKRNVISTYKDRAAAESILQTVKK